MNEVIRVGSLFSRIEVLIKEGAAGEHSLSEREKLKGQEEINLRTYMHSCITHGHRQQPREGLGGGAGVVWRGPKWEKIEDTCNTSTIKEKERKEKTKGP